MITLTIPPPPPAIVLIIPAPVVPLAPAFCFDRLADAIRAVENAGSRQRGRSGEWGAWQIMPAIWRRYSQQIQYSAPLSEQRRVAILHLKMLASKLELARMEPDPFHLALAWNAGETKVINQRFSMRHWDYADRCSNLYYYGIQKEGE